ncbi:hypothetical protein [Streptomyces smaragdinus]|uniref:hypothetical protein n=1 Tax=Streptomyces smaragdinus TaxID=2585196 RepID=UPI00129666CE|nr:hypothetical protein [Streptomyces smaragdinus]
MSFDEICTLNVELPRINPGTRRIEGPATVTCKQVALLIELQVFVNRKGDSTATRINDKTRDNKVFTLVAETASCRSGEWKTSAVARVTFSNPAGYVETKGGYNPPDPAPGLQLNC